MDEVQKQSVNPSASQNGSRKKGLTPQDKAKKLKSKRAAEEFKKRYFSFYDDVKISDREDW